MTLKTVLTFLTISQLSCSTGNLTTICKLPKSLEEVSGMALTNDQQSFWMIEDSGNADHIYAVSKSGEILHTLNLDKSAKNIDWEALTTDIYDNLYIGDFGNNSKNRKSYDIYIVSASDLTNQDKVTPQKITFKLPKKQKALDFEAFILMKNNFYLFSKEKSKTSVWKIPNAVGSHTAVYVTEYLFSKKNTKITDAAINIDQNMIALLNHDKVWILKDFSGTDFFQGTVEQFPFAHNSQKEGLCFSVDDNLYITDEQTKNHGGNLYQFDLNH